MMNKSCQFDNYSPQIIDDHPLTTYVIVIQLSQVNHVIVKPQAKECETTK